jgi:MFS family permease
VSTPTPTESPSSAPDQIALGDMLRDRAFLLYLIGQTTSGAGSALASIALVFAVLSISDSASSVGLVLLVSRLPAVVLVLAGGVIADRWSRKWLAVVTDAIRAVSQAVTGALLLSGHATVVEIAGLQLVSGSASALFGPAANALLTEVAPRGQIRRASSLLGITTAITQTGGLAIAGVLVALAGPGTSLLIDAVTFAVSSLTLALIPIAAPALKSGARSVLSDLREGLQLFKEHRWLAVYSIHETIVDVLVLSPFFVLGPVIADADLGGAAAWSAIAFGYVVGNLIASNITYRWAPRRPVFAALVLNVALAPMIALIGVSAPIWLIVPAALLGGAATTIYNTLLSTAVQANLPEHTLGRATAVTTVGSTMLVPLGMGLAGVAAGALGTTTVMLGAAALIVITSGMCVLLPATRAVLALDRPRTDDGKLSAGESGT